ncbi:FAD-binding oxidoreductase [Undibacterium sp. LX40W]|uniref:FAD-binding oxidoreductase n=1 Tax=Undibacterium nitidum TaxID=2762298 RepID=A0A923HJ77_9BURK|nr:MULTISPECIES: FAD-binding oxidoreductase [Undibacterium]MBC3880705.1 FAD-binding oxidoreductase [Undibacterium nitidum]MBC3890560.1 FAD-binding oxidoreductase [Undibacterium sp. LX40W]
MTSQTFYQATADVHSYPPLETDLDIEVCIIGAGFAGLATALGLLERGIKNLVILEAENVGYGASGRNGGFVFGGFSLDNKDLVRQLGSQKASALYQLTIDAVNLIRQRIERYDIACDKNESGVLLTNWFDDDRSLLAQRDFMRSAFDVEWDWIKREQLRELLHTDRYFGALHEKNAFHFHPLKYAQGLARVMSKQGGLVFEQTRVRSIKHQGAMKIVETDAGQSIRAKHVVVACGGYIEQLYPQLSRAVLPIATYAMATEPLGEILASAMQTQAAVYDTRFAFDYYRPLPDTRILWGGRISITQRTPERVEELLYRDMLKVYPQLAGTRVDFAWSGLMSYGRHKMPQIGQLADGVWYGLGFGGHGVAPTTLAGEVLASAILGAQRLPDGLERYRSPTTFGYLGLLGAQMTYWYYELRDWLRQ